MRWSLAGSTGSLGSVYASRLPFPFVSRISAVQPCDFCSSLVCSNIFTLSQPTAPPPPPLEVHKVLLASSANCKWWVEKHVSISVNCLVLGSYIESCRPLRSRGNNFADGWLEPCLQ